MPEVTQILWGMSYWLISMAVVLLFIPVERYFPRIRSGKPDAGHFKMVVLFSLAPLAVSLLLHFYMQNQLILYFLELKVISISKLPLEGSIIFVASFMLLDFLNYLRHVVAHRVSLIWRLHAVHHSDEHLTGVSHGLHHPLENLLGMVWLMFFSVVLGIPLVVYISYGVFIAIHGVISHADIAIPHRLERAIRLLIVTPDVHRIHHSIRMREGNSNFGQVFTLWDRMFGTYLDSPATGDAMLVMGLPDSEKPRAFTIGGLLLHPFVWRRNRKPT